MEIIWLGHSCFRLKGKESTVITDPYDVSLPYTLGKSTANIVTVSHDHPGHNYAQGIAPVTSQTISEDMKTSFRNGPYVVKGPGEYEIADILITGTATFHDNEGG